jgi:hypothetical protein
MHGVLIGLLSKHLLQDHEVVSMFKMGVRVLGVFMLPLSFG